MKKMLLLVLSISVLLLSACSKIEDTTTPSDVSSIESSEASSAASSKAAVSSRPVNSTPKVTNDTPSKSGLSEYEKQKLEYDKKVAELNRKIEAKKEELEKVIQNYNDDKWQYEKDVAELNKQISNNDVKIKELSDYIIYCSNQAAHGSSDFWDGVRDETRKKSDELKEMQCNLKENLEKIENVFDTKTVTYNSTKNLLQEELTALYNTSIQ